MRLNSSSCDSWSRQSQWRVTGDSGQPRGSRHPLEKLLRNHAHDSIGGCNSDATNRDILHRMEQTEQLCHSLWNLVVKTTAAACVQDGDLLILTRWLPQRSAW